MNYKWTMMKNPLKYDVVSDGKVAIPAGSLGVEIAFKQSSKFHVLPTGQHMNLNVYRWNGNIYHA